MATAFILLMALGSSHEYLTKYNHGLLHHSCLGYGKVTTFSRMQIALQLVACKFQLHLCNKDEFFQKLHFWLNSSCTGFNDMAPADFR